MTDEPKEPRKPRKMPKNQRAYPKKGKPVMLEITDSYTLRILEVSQADIGAPQLVDGRFVDAKQFRKWKAGLTTNKPRGVE